MKIPKNAKIKKTTKIEVEEIDVDINVTATDIKKGEQENSHTCAIARSLKARFSEDDVDVTEYEIVVGEYSMEDVPGKVVTFIKKFDEDKNSVKPFSFRLKLKKSA